MKAIIDLDLLNLLIIETLIVVGTYTFFGLLAILLDFIFNKKWEQAETNISEQEPSVEIVNTEESNDNGTKYLNINVSDGEVKRNPDVVRLCSDVGILEYVKPSGDLISRKVVLDAIKRISLGQTDAVKVSMMTEEYVKRIPPVNPQEPKSVLENIKTEIKEWYWQADKQRLAQDPCVVDAMIDLFIRTIDSHISGEPQESEE